ncbi:MAG: hypothetical protein JNG88_14525 [Phycisphaerales bacterium]|nr:hypothetical protein [Phycisphaerales bacterium]
MLRQNWAKTMLALLISISAVAVGQDKTGEEKHPAPPSNPVLEKMRKLAGEWIEAQPESGKPAQTVSVFRVVGAGSAVAETMFPGSDHEMITMYHLDGDVLTLTHYCAMGNQPRMKARPGKDANKIEFEFSGGTNVDEKKGAHMHSMILTFVDDNNITEEWTHYTDGKSTGGATFKLTRKK